MRKRKIKRQFKNFRIYKELYEKPLKHDWVGRVVFLIQILLLFAGGCNCCFWDIWLKIFRSPNFNNYAHSACASKRFPKHTVFVFTKSWSGDQLRNQLMQKAYCNKSAETTVIKYIVVQRCFILRMISSDWKWPEKLPLTMCTYLLCVPQLLLTSHYYLYHWCTVHEWKINKNSTPKVMSSDQLDWKD